MDVLDVEALARLVQKKRRYFNDDELNNYLAPQFDNTVLSFRMGVFGRAGTGKTGLIVSAILQSDIKFEHIYLFVKDPSQGKYQLLLMFVDAMEKEYERLYGKKRSFGTVVTKAEDIPSIDDVDPNIINLAIFDDLMMEKDQTLIEEYFIRGRNKNMNCIYLAQDYHYTSPIIRKQCEYFAIFGVSSKAELIQLAKDHSLEYNFQEFKDILNKATHPKHNFLLIDRRTDNPLLLLRKNWDHVIETTIDPRTGAKNMEFVHINDLIKKYGGYLTEDTE